MKCPECQSENPLTSHFYSDCETLLIPSGAILSPTKTLENPKDESITVSSFTWRYQIAEELGKVSMRKAYKGHDI